MACARRARVRVCAGTGPGPPGMVHNQATSSRMADMSNTISPDARNRSSVLLFVPIPPVPSHVSVRSGPPSPRRISTKARALVWLCPKFHACLNFGFGAPLDLPFAHHLAPPSSFEKDCSTDSMTVCFVRFLFLTFCSASGYIEISNEGTSNYTWLINDCCVSNDHYPH